MAKSRFKRFKHIFWCESFFEKNFPNILIRLIHPAALRARPLFAARKEGEKNILTLFAKQRGAGQRSVVGVSKIARMQI